MESGIRHPVLLRGWRDVRAAPRIEAGRLRARKFQDAGTPRPQGRTHELGAILEAFSSMESGTLSRWGFGAGSRLRGKRSRGCSINWPRQIGGRWVARGSQV